MIRIYNRAIDDADLKEMKKGHGSLFRNLLKVTLPIFLVLFVVFYLVFKSLLAAATISGLFLIASMLSNIRFFREVRRRETSKGDEQAVQVMEVEAFRVFDIEHLGSHGPAYCFFVDNGKALLLVGQWMLPYRRFPSLSFSLHRWSDSGEPIRVEVRGGRVKPEHSTVALRQGYRNSDIELFDANPETLQEDLQNSFGKSAA
jgi:hypothetical protein